MSRFALNIVVVLFWASSLSLAQSSSGEVPRQLNGSLVFGWTETTAREFFEESRSNGFTTLRLNFQNYFLHPTFLTYAVQGRLSSGFQDGITGISEGSGVFIDTTFLPTRPWPFRFYYSRYRRSSLITGLGSSYARFAAQNDDASYGFQWHYAAADRPALDLSFDKVSASTTPEQVLTQGFETRSRTLALKVRDFRKGWHLNGGLSFQRFDTQYLLGSAQGGVLFKGKSNVGNGIFTAQRPFRRDWNFLFSANRTKNKNELDRDRFDQTFDSFLGKLEYKPGRFQIWSQGRLTRSALESRSSLLLDGSLFLTPSARISNRMWDTEARYRVRPYLTLLGRSEFTQIVAPENELAQRAGNAWHGVSGAQFVHSHKTLVLASSYYLYTTLNRQQKDAQGTLLGHAFDASVSVGDPSLVSISGLVAVNRSREDVRNLFFTTSDLDRWQLSVARTILHRWTLELQGGLARTNHERQGLRYNFMIREYGANLRASHFYLGYRRMVGSGESFEPLTGPIGTPLPGPIPPFLAVVGSSNSNTTLNGSWNITRSIVLRGAWRGQAQRLGSQLSSRSEQQEAVLEWTFRRIRFDAGYLVYRFNFGSPIYRRGILLRVTRDFRLF